MEETSLALPLIIYDSHCSLCKRFTQALQRLPGTSHIHKTSIHNNKLYEEFPQLSKEQCHQVIHLILEDKKVLKGAEAIEYLIEQFPGVSRFSWLIESRMGKKVVSYFHQVTNNARRSLIKRCPACKNNDT